MTNKNEVNEIQFEADSQATIEAQRDLVVQPGTDPQNLLSEEADPILHTAETGEHKNTSRTRDKE